MFKKAKLFMFLVPLLLVASHSLAEDVETYAVEVSVKKNLSDAVSLVKNIFESNKVTLDRVEVDYENSRAFFFVILGGESVRSYIESLFKENSSLFPSDFRLRSVLTNQEWLESRPVNFAVEYTVNGDVNESVKKINQILAETEIRVWGSVTFEKENRGVIFVKLPAGGTAERVEDVLTENTTVLPTSFVLSSVKEYESWLSGE